MLVGFLFLAGYSAYSAEDDTQYLSFDDQVNRLSASSSWQPVEHYEDGSPSVVIGPGGTMYTVIYDEDGNVILEGNDGTSQFIENTYGEDTDTSVKTQRPFLYYFFSFIDPPFLDNYFFHVLTIMLAVGLPFTVPAFEGQTKSIVIILCLYCWGRIIKIFIVSALIG